MIADEQEKVIKIMYKNKIAFKISNIKNWNFKKELLEHTYLLEFQDNENNFIFECQIKDKKKVEKHLESGFLNLEEIYFI